MKKDFLRKAAAISIISFCAFPAFAEDQVTPDLKFSANVGFVTEYSFRGIAQSNEGPAVQGGFDVEHSSGLYAGVWGSNVDFNDGDEASMELDVFGGYAGSYENFNYDLGVLYYAYPGADSSLDYDYMELSASVGYDFKVVSVAAAFNYSPENFADSGDAEYYALSFEAPLPYDISFNGHIGHQDIDDEDAFGVEDYNDWSLGVGYNLKGFDLSVQYVDTDLDEPDECADGCSGRVIAGISKSF